MPRNSMPSGWEPPAPAWESVWDDQTDPLVTGFFGLQGSDPAILDEWAARAFSSSNPPLSVERGSFVDKRGVKNFVYITYWRAAEYRNWWSQAANASWWADPERLTEGVGYWREIITMPFDRFETLHSTETPHGVGVSAESSRGPILEHGYAGGMRDRIQLSDTDELKNIDSVESELPSTETDQGQRILLTPPRNMCVIRSGQNWSLCDEDEKAYYREKMHPVLLTGMRFLRDNPRESNCYSLRFVDCKDSTWGDTEQSFGLGYSTDVYAFEQWAKSHPTHLAIFGGFMQMVETFGENMRLRLWHEVTVLPEEGCEFEYIACHRDTGLLSYT